MRLGDVTDSGILILLKEIDVRFISLYSARGYGLRKYGRPPLTNRYTQVAAAYPLYDDAGNLTKDPVGYEYGYDYENRIVDVNRPDHTPIAHFVYDALGRRIEKNDVAAGKKTRYYYNDKWQVTCQYDITGETESFGRCFVYGNYIDEALLMKTPSQTYYYGHDQLYSPVVLVDAGGTAQDRYEYDAYGACRVLNADYTADADGKPDCGNPYLFTGREVDFLDNGLRILQYNRHRYYLQGIGRWTSEDPLGIDPAGELSENPFSISAQYTDALSMYDGDTWVRNWMEIYEHGDASVVPYDEKASHNGQYKDGINLYQYVVSNPLCMMDARGTDVYLKTGNDTGNPVNDRIHQNVCVDKWRGDCKDGLACFSFGKTGYAWYWPKRTWLGWQLPLWQTNVPMYMMQGHIYDAEDTGHIVRTKTTTADQDERWLKWMLRERLDTPDVYTVAFLNCRKYAQMEFADAPGSH